MTVTEKLRTIIIASGQTHYRIGNATGMNIRNLDKFVARETSPSGANIDKLCEYFSLELCKKKKRKTRKQTSRKE